MPAAMARRPILSIGVCFVVALSVLSSTSPSNFFAASAKAAPATARASSTAAEASSKKRKFTFGPATLKMLLPAADLPILFQAQKEKDAKILASPRGDWYPFFVTNRPLKVGILTGEVDEVCASVQKMSELFEEKNRSSVTHRFLVPRTTEGLLIGEGGKNIQNANSETGANIWIENSPSNEDMVCIQGASKTVTAAAKWLLDTLQGQRLIQKLNTAYHTTGSSSHQTELDLHIPKDKVGRVIGKGGTSLARYSRDCLCKLDMNSEKCTLKVTGCLGDVQMAVRYIMQELSSETM